MRGRRPDAIVPGTSPVASVPEAPGWFSDDARAEWDRVAPILITERRTLTVADLATFAHYCTAVGQVAEASRIIAEEGMTFQTEGGPKKHPAVSIRSDGLTQARQSAGELGLTPVSRSRPAMRNDDGDDDASDLAL